MLKQLLTEGERYLMTAFHLLEFAEQGLYDVVSNLGSLAARFLFQPVEENAYVYFSRTVQRGKVRPLMDGGRGDRIKQTEPNLVSHWKSCCEVQSW